MRRTSPCRSRARPRRPASRKPRRTDFSQGPAERSAGPFLMRGARPPFPHCYCERSASSVAGRRDRNCPADSRNLLRDPCTRPARRRVRSCHRLRACGAGHGADHRRRCGLARDPCRHRRHGALGQCQHHRQPHPAAPLSAVGARAGRGRPHSAQRHAATGCAGLCGRRHPPERFRRPVGQICDPRLRGRREHRARYPDQPLRQQPRL